MTPDAEKAERAALLDAMWAVAAGKAAEYTLAAALGIAVSTAQDDLGLSEESFLRRAQAAWNAGVLFDNQGDA